MAGRVTRSAAVAATLANNKIGDDDGSLIFLEAASVLKAERRDSAISREIAGRSQGSNGPAAEDSGGEETKDDVTASADRPQMPLPPSAAPPSLSGGVPVKHPSVEKRGPDPVRGANEGIDARYFKQTLQQIEKGHDICCHVVYSLLFTVLFVVVVVIHLDPTATYQVEATLVDEFISTTYSSGNKAYADINSYTNWWLWVNEVVVPKSFKQYDDLGFLLDTTDWSRIATFNKLVAGVRLSTYRANNISCPNPALVPLYGQSDCYDLTSNNVDDYGSPPCNYENTDVTACYNKSQYVDIVNTSYNEGFRARGDDHFEFFLDKYDKIEITQQRLDYAQERRWLDDATTKTRVEILTYNGELDLFSFLIMTQWYHRGGDVLVKYEISSAFSAPYRLWWWALLDAIFLLSVLYKFVHEALELWPYLRKCNMSGYFLNEDGWWNIVDWTAILLSLLLVGFWLKYVVQMNSVTRAFQEVGDENLAIGVKIQTNRNFLNSDKYQAYLYQIQDVGIKLMSAVNTRNLVRYIAAFNSFMIILRFFKVARFLPRANLLVSTVEMAAVDLIHYAVVFLVVLLAFAIEGWLVFGHRIYEFGTLWYATQTSMLIVMGAVDTTALYANMYIISPVITVVWYWSFFFITILLVMNLLIAIIIDAYAAARGNVKEGDTLWGEVIHIRRILTLYWRSGYLRPRDLLRCFEPGGSLHGVDVITPDLLVEKVEAPNSFVYWHTRIAGVRACCCCSRPSTSGSTSASARKAIVTFGGSLRRANAGFSGSGDSDAESMDAPAYGSEAPVTKQEHSVGSSVSQTRARRRTKHEQPGQLPGNESSSAPLQACEAPEQTVYLDRLYAEYLVANAREDKVDTDEAHGMSLSAAAKEIADALIYVRLMGERFSSMEECLEEFLTRQADLMGGGSGAATPLRIRLRARDVPEPPLTRRAHNRMLSIVAHGDVAAAAATAAAAMAASAADGQQN